MANADKPNGFTPIGTLSGADYHGKMRRVAFAAGDSTAAYVGDLVKLTGTTDASGKIPVVAQSAAADASIGVLVSLDIDAEPLLAIIAATIISNKLLNSKIHCFLSAF